MIRRFKVFTVVLMSSLFMLLFSGKIFAYSPGDNVYFGEYGQNEVFTALESDKDLREYFNKLEANEAGVVKFQGKRYQRVETGFGGVYDYITFTPLKWRVLEDNGSTVLLMTEQVVGRGTYINDINMPNKNWANSDIRKWMNGLFYDNAFSDNEKQDIITSTVRNGGIDGPDTEDKVFALSRDEAINSSYGLGTENSRKATSTKAANWYWNDEGKNHAWWTRSKLTADPETRPDSGDSDPFYNGIKFYYVNSEGNIADWMCHYDYNYRPVIRVNKNSPYLIDHPTTEEDSPYLTSYPTINIGDEDISGANVNFLGREISLVKFNTGLNLAGFKFTTEVDPNKKELYQTVGLGDDEPSIETKVELETKLTKEETEIGEIIDWAKKMGAEKKETNIGPKMNASILGYFKYSYATGEPLLKEGGFLITGEVKHDLPKYRFASSGGLAYLKVVLSGNANGSVGLKQVQANDLGKKVFADFLVTLGVQTGIGIGEESILHCEAGLNGSLNIDIDYLEDKRERRDQAMKVSVQGNGYIEGSLLWNHADAQTPSFKEQIYPKQKKAQALSIDSTVQFKPINRDYLNRAQSQASNSSDNFEIDSVYPNGEPRILALSDGRILAVWVDDNGQKTNFAQLMYSIRSESGNWSKPKVVDSSGRADLGAKIGSDGKNVFILFGRSSNDLNENSTIEQILSSIELVCSKFNGSGFSSPVIINEAGKAPLIYTMNVQNGRANISWLTNKSNSLDYTSKENMIYYRSYDGIALSQKQTVKDNAGYVNSIAVIGSDVYYSNEYSHRDTDSLIRKTSSPFTEEKTLANTGTMPSNLKVFNNQLYWISNQEDLMKLDQSTDQPIKVGAKCTNNYRVLENGAELTVISKDSSGYYSNIYSTKGTIGGTWSELIPQTEETGNITYFDAVQIPNSSDILLAYDIKEVKENNNIFSFGDTDFIITRAQNQYDLQVSPYLYYESANPEQTTRFKADVTNIGSNSVNSFKIEVVDSNGNQSIIPVSKIIAPGTTETVMFDYTLPSDIKNYSIKATVLPDSFTDCDLTNNVARAEFNSGVEDIEPEKPSQPTDPDQPSQSDKPSTSDQPAQPSSPSNQDKPMPIYRLYNSYTGEHLYTPSPDEVKSLTNAGWTDEGTGWNAPKSGTPVYRIFNPEISDHLYTSDQNEVNILTSSRGWIKDFNGQPIFYSANSGISVYRLYNDGNKRHLLTKDQNEYNVLPTYGWRQEGISLYGF